MCFPFFSCCEIRCHVWFWNDAPQILHHRPLSVSLQTLADLIDWPHQSQIKVVGFRAGQVNQRTTPGNQSSNILLDLKELGRLWRATLYVSSSDAVTYVFGALVFSLSMSVSLLWGGGVQYFDFSYIISHFDLFNLGFEGHGYAHKTMVTESTVRDWDFLYRTYFVFFLFRLLKYLNTNLMLEIKVWEQIFQSNWSLKSVWSVCVCPCMFVCLRVCVCFLRMEVLYHLLLFEGKWHEILKDQNCLT